MKIIKESVMWKHLLITEEEDRTVFFPKNRFILGLAVTKKVSKLLDSFQKLDTFSF